jgi:hypothetical protein
VFRASKIPANQLNVRFASLGFLLGFSLLSLLEPAVGVGPEAPVNPLLSTNRDESQKAVAASAFYYFHFHTRSFLF